MKNNLIGLMLLLGLTAQAQNHSHSSTTSVKYPNIKGYQTLSTDLHIHSVFSDGNVWPTIRVQEALMEGLDVISMTEHLEYQPHSKDIPHPDRNRSYELALAEAKDHGLIVIPGSEITRSAPVGHNNAVFIQDANPILTKEAQDAFNQAKKQDAFVFWNHPAWYAQSPKGVPVITEFQLKQIKEKKLHGIEVINTGDYSEEALQIALDHNLTIMGTSDVHDLIEWDFTKKGVHRPITLVFAEQRDAASVRKALFEGKTVAVFNHLFVGKSEFLVPLIEASIVLSDAKYIPNTEILEVTLNNTTSSNLLFENQMPYTFYHHAPVFEIPAQGSIKLQIKTGEKLDEFTLRLKALKAYSAPKTQVVAEWKIIPLH
jgi:hypothetical protein